MKATLILLTFLGYACVVAGEVGQRGYVLQGSVGVGGVQYEERVSISPVSSEWEADAASLRLRGVVTGHTVQPYAEFGYKSSREEVEQWRENGFLVQENDLTYTGGTMRLGLQVSMFLFDSLRVVPRLGGTVSVDEYTRDNFLFLVEDATLFRLERNVVETIVTAGPTAGVHLSFQVTDSVSVQLDTELAWLTFAEADNDGFNISIDAEEGWNWVGEVTLAKKLSRPGHQIGVSVIAEVTEIEGSVLITPEQVFEYPDNTLEEIMMEVFWSASF